MRGAGRGCYVHAVVMIVEGVLLCVCGGGGGVDDGIRVYGRFGRASGVKVN